MVTHEPDVAEYADRKVIFKDGLIIDEVIIKKLKKRKK
jgi:ABC-type lipoprotein export system ATPase subunit